MRKLNVYEGCLGHDKESLALQFAGWYYDTCGLALCSDIHNTTTDGCWVVDPDTEEDIDVCRSLAFNALVLALKTLGEEGKRLQIWYGFGKDEYNEYTFKDGQVHRTKHNGDFVYGERDCA